VNQRVAVTLHVDEGSQYRLARITFRNNRPLANYKTLRSLFSIDDGEIFRRTSVLRGLEDLRRAYGEFGYLNTTLVPNTDIDEDVQTISLEVDVDEGKQFFVRQIRITGFDDETSDSMLRDFPLQRGSVYNQRLAELFFNNPALGLPAAVSTASRIHLDLDEQRGTVAIAFDVRACPGGSLTLDRSSQY
jgi:outer membrane protein insertion porin family